MEMEITVANYAEHLRKINNTTTRQDLMTGGDPILAKIRAAIRQGGWLVVDIDNDGKIMSVRPFASQAAANKQAAEWRRNCPGGDLLVWRAGVLVINARDCQ